MTMREQLQERVGKPHLSYSSLKYALGDMRLWEMYMRGQLKKESEALFFGSLYDMLLFEPEKANDLYHPLNDSHIVDSIGGRSPRSTKKYSWSLLSFSLEQARQSRRSHRRTFTWKIPSGLPQILERLLIRVLLMTLTL